MKSDLHKEQIDNQERKLIKIVPAIATSDGAGVKLSRSLGSHLLPEFDPFLMLDEFKSDEPSDYIAGFPSHPHRGFETITYMLAGAFEHQDNRGNREMLSDGEVQWMIAGKGIVHSEMPVQNDGLVWGFQLWLNLPSKTKMQVATYQNLRKTDIPLAIFDNGVSVKSIAGNLQGLEGPIQRPDTEPIYLDIDLPANLKWQINIPESHQVLVYVIENEVQIPGGSKSQTIKQNQLGILGKGSLIQFATYQQATRFLLLAGIPIQEPIVKHGPFVMNTSDQIQQAIKDYHSGEFE